MELKPCPFCGRRPEIDECRMPVYPAKATMRIISNYRVQCRSCFGMTVETDWFEDVGDAYDAWNERSRDED